MGKFDDIAKRLGKESVEANEAENAVETKAAAAAAAQLTKEAARQVDLDAILTLAKQSLDSLADDLKEQKIKITIIDARASRVRTGTYGPKILVLSDGRQVEMLIYSIMRGEWTFGLGRTPATPDPSIDSVIVCSNRYSTGTTKQHGEFKTAATQDAIDNAIREMLKHVSLKP